MTPGKYNVARPDGSLAGACARQGRILLSGALLTLAAPVTAGAETPMDFDIPAQSLAAALAAYGTTTGSLALYDGRLTLGRRSTGVQGRMTPRAALTVLLRDSGLKAAYTAPQAFVLVLRSGADEVVTAPAAIAQAALSGQGERERRFAARVQATITGALCGRDATRPGGYRAVIRFRVEPSGEVTRLTLLGPTGDAVRDAAIADVAGLSVGEPPPPRMAQPFTMVVLPRSSGGADRCAPAGSGAPGSGAP